MQCNLRAVLPNIVLVFYLDAVEKMGSAMGVLEVREAFVKPSCCRADCFRGAMRRDRAGNIA